jgi:hypothetical protein
MGLGILDKDYVRATAGSSDEHADIAPDLFTAETPLDTYQGIAEMVLSRTPDGFRSSCRAARVNPNGCRFEGTVSEREFLKPPRKERMR